MLNDSEVIATVAVSDLRKAAEFYEGQLGLKRESTEGEEAITYRSGSAKLLVYRSQYAASNKATSATWEVEDAATLARELKQKGIVFEHYDMPELTLQGDVYVSATMQVAWFKDPDGNTLSIVSSS